MKLRSLNFLWVLVLSACSLFSSKAEKVEEPTAKESSAPHIEEVQAVAAQTAVDSHHGAGAGHEEKASHNSGHHEPVVGVAPELSLKWLQNGNTRFVKNRRRVDGSKAVDRLRLSKGQKPHAIILSCADSRVPPEHVFDQALGEVFVVRVAGEALDSSVIASIEYAVAHLGSRLIVVLGHESCGAVKASYETGAGQSAGSPALDSLVSDIKARLPQNHASGASENFIVESKANARGVATDLLSRSNIVRSAVEKGDLKIVNGLYYLKSGKVEFF